jgi:hypothetical protein
MKTNYLLLTGIFWAFTFHTSIAQRVENVFPCDSAEIEFYRKTYDVDKDTSASQNGLRSSGSQTTSTYIYNVDKGELTGHSSAGGCYNLKESTPLADVIKAALSKEKIKLLGSDDRNKIVIYFAYDMNTGKVVFLRFIVRGKPLSEDLNSETAITLRDIHRLETFFKEYYFDISAGCVNRETNDHYGNWTVMFRFSKLAEAAEEEEK